MKLQILTIGILVIFVISGCQNDMVGEAKGGAKPPSLPKPQCSDAKDNDGDGLCDYSGCRIGKGRTGVSLSPDSDCESAEDNSESGATQCIPSGEICDGVDNDCDSSIDGINKQCGSDIGLCVKGVQICNNGVWTDCEGEIPPSEEICGNNIDEDCDGSDLECQDPTTNSTRPSMDYIWISPDEAKILPMSGLGWDTLFYDATNRIIKPDLSNQDDQSDAYTVAKALVYLRTGDASLRKEVYDSIKSAIGTECDDPGNTACPGGVGATSLSLGRGLGAYVIAADMIDLESYNSTFNDKFKQWLYHVVRRTNYEGRTLITCHEQRPNNWGAHCGASRIAVALYTDDQQELDRSIQVFKGFMGDRDSYAKFSYGDLSWQCDESNPVPINSLNCTKDGHYIDGVLPDDQRRCGTFSWPPCKTNYVWECLQGHIASAYMLSRKGYSSFEWENNALLRAVNWLYETNFDGSTNYPAEGDDIWQVWIINDAYGSSFPLEYSKPGKMIGYSEWTHQ